LTLSQFRNYGWRIKKGASRHPAPPLCFAVTRLSGHAQPSCCLAPVSRTSTMTARVGSRRRRIGFGAVATWRGGGEKDGGHQTNSTPVISTVMTAPAIPRAVCFDHHQHLLIIHQALTSVGKLLLPRSVPDWPRCMCPKPWAVVRRAATS